MKLTTMDIALLEDCLGDWHGLWEVAWMEPDAPLQDRASLVKSLVEANLLDVLRLTEWKQAREAPHLSREEALLVVSNSVNYAPPPNDIPQPFYALSTNGEGEAAVEAWHGASQQ